MKRPLASSTSRHDARRPTLDAASIADIDPEFTVTVTGGTGTVAFDTTISPVLLDATTNKYRYFLVATARSPHVSIAPIAKSWTGTNPTTGVRPSTPAR
jgi:hypothetical protein